MPKLWGQFTAFTDTKMAVSGAGYLGSRFQSNTYTYRMDNVSTQTDEPGARMMSGTVTLTEATTANGSTQAIIVVARIEPVKSARLRTSQQATRQIIRRCLHKTRTAYVSKACRIHTRSRRPTLMTRCRCQRCFPDGVYPSQSDDRYCRIGNSLATTPYYESATSRRTGHVSDCC